MPKCTETATAAAKPTSPSVVAALSASLPAPIPSPRESLSLASDWLPPPPLAAPLFVETAVVLTTCVATADRLTSSALIEPPVTVAAVFPVTSEKPSTAPAAVPAFAPALPSAVVVTVTAFVAPIFAVPPAVKVPLTTVTVASLDTIDIAITASAEVLFTLPSAALVSGVRDTTVVTVDVADSVKSPAASMVPPLMVTAASESDSTPPMAMTLMLKKLSPSTSTVESAVNEILRPVNVPLFITIADEALARISVPNKPLSLLACDSIVISPSA